MTTNEKAFIVALIQEYTKIHANIEKYEDQLNRLDGRLKIKDSEKLYELEYSIKLEVEKLATFRNVELEFWDVIEKKYGPGEFDPAILEYKIKKNV